MTTENNAAPSGLTPCAECGMPCEPAEYHPYTACLLFKQTRDAKATRDALNAVYEHARERLAAPKAAEQASVADAARGEAVAWEIASPTGERPSLAFLTSKKPTVEHYEDQGWRVTPLYRAAPAQQAVTLTDDARDAARYRWLREQHWSEAHMFVVAGSKSRVLLGTDCPTLDRLDEAIDAALQSHSEGDAS